MYRKWLLLAGVLDLFILSLLDKIAFQYYLYWRFPWFDIVMHLVGGVAIGLVSAYVYWEWQKENSQSDLDKDSHLISHRKLFFGFNLGFILSLGIGWEIFEVLVDRIVKLSLVNSLEDLFFGVIGSLSAGLFVLWFYNHKQKKLK